MPHLITKLTCLLTVIALTAIGSQAQADIHRHIDQAAVKIRSKAKQLTKETKHYRHTPEYQYLVSDTDEIYRLADHIHKVTHYAGNLNYLESDLNQLDRQFCHLVSMFDRIELAAAHGHGRVKGNTAHVKRLLDSIEGCIYEIRADVRTLRSRVVVAKPVYKRPTYTRPVYVPTYGGKGHAKHGGRGYGGNKGFGISIGGGSTKIHFQF